MSIHVFGIRHHGPGSARNVRASLETLKPDIILVEGPPEGDGILQWAGHPELKLPAAILCYQPDDPNRSVFYPFAEFSPEWQAILFGKENRIPVRFFDLPMAHRLALEKEAEAEVGAEEGEGENPDVKEEGPLASEATTGERATGTDIRKDPLSYLAEAAGYPDGEKWWEELFEYRHNSEEVFTAVAEAMTALRDELKLPLSRVERMREAWMRKAIRQAERELYTTIAVVCGAWHAPALIRMPKQKEDSDLLKGLPKVKLECTWVPWTYGRLSYYSGYGAGIESPGWYEHLWNYPGDDGTRWMSKVAGLFRKNGMDTSVAHVIEGVRLAESLASLRGFSRAGLEELGEATLSVLCHGESVLMELIRKELIVSNVLGDVPQDIPKPPLQVDIERTQKSLRLQPAADFKDYTLDLRKENDLLRSVFLHRLQLLGLEWGKPLHVTGKGTFKEQWRLQWDPSLSVDIIEKGAWGNTVEEAAQRFVLHEAGEAGDLLTVAELLRKTLPAELHEAAERLIEQINNLAAASADVLQLMEATPPLVQVARYGNVRGTDADLVLKIVHSMITRITVGLPNAVTGIDEESATNLLEKMAAIGDDVSLLQVEEISRLWQGALSVIAASGQTAPVISGYATRLLFDLRILEGVELIKAFHFRMSSSFLPDVNAAWLEGFLRGSGSILLVDANLWILVNEWVAGLDSPSFNRVLPLLRRTFSLFNTAERRKLGEKVKSGKSDAGLQLVQERDVNTERARKGIPVVLRLLGKEEITKQT